MLSEDLKSSSIFLAVFLSKYKSSTPEIAKIMATFSGSCLKIIGGSIPTGNEAIRSTAFFTSWSAWSVLFACLTSTIILPAFSMHVEVTRSIFATPWRFSSIFATIPFSISSGEEPGYTT